MSIKRRFLLSSFLVALLPVAVGLRSADRPRIPPRFRSEVDLVLVRVTVTDPLNRYVVGLEKDSFKVYEEKIEQKILHFSTDKAPISVGFVLDTSGSMGDKVLAARNSIVRFLEQGDPQDEYFLVTFNQTCKLAQDFTSRRENIRNAISISTAKGRTALYDAVYLGLEKIRQARNDKKALIVITDGEDNSSRYTFTELRDFARESDALIYVIGERGDLGYGQEVIEEIVGLSGGRAFFPSSLNQLDYYCDLIHTELRNQYLIAYRPTNRDFDGKWRRIKVKLDPPEGLPRLAVRAREGYYAPTR
jgi:Ca-activated chloride channel family protein